MIKVQTLPLYMRTCTLVLGARSEGAGHKACLKHPYWSRRHAPRHALFLANLAYRKTTVMNGSEGRSQHLHIYSRTLPHHHINHIINRQIYAIN